MSKKDQLINEPNTTQIPNVLLDYWVHELNEVEFKVIMCICRKTFGWHKKKDRISISQICEMTGKTDRPVQRAISRLLHFKLINRTINKNKGGDNSPNSFEINVIQLNKKEKLDRGGGGASATGGGRQRHGGVTPAPPTKPTTFKPTLSKGIACESSDVHNSPSEDLNGVEDLEEVPFHKEKKEEKATPKSKSSRKYPRPAHEEEVFQWLKTLNLNTNENTLSFWAHKFPRQKLQNTWSHLKHKMSKGYVPDNIGGLFKTLLDTEMCPVTDDCLKNKQIAENFKKNTGWASLEIRERFCCDDDRPDYDLPYMIPESDFKERIVRMWELKTGQQFRGQKVTTKQKSYEENYDSDESYDD